VSDSRLERNGTGLYARGDQDDGLHLENVVLVENGLALRADSQGPVVVRNGTIASNSQGLYLSGGAPQVEIDNTIIAYNSEFGVAQTAFATEGSLTIRQSLVYNPAGVDFDLPGGADGTALIEQNGNLRADPHFVDRHTGDYELAAISPAIDAGRAHGAPLVDFFGRPRFDDPGAANLGTGVPSYIDIGALERQEPSPPNNLSVQFPGFYPGTVIPGDELTVAWSVYNAGEGDLSGEWADRVHLSSDPYLSPDTDLFLGEVIYSDGLASGQWYDQTLTAIVPQQALAPMYVLVQANASRVIQEAHVSDNVAASSESLAVNVPVLEFNQPLQDMFTSDQHHRYYHVSVEAGEHLRVTLDGLDDQGHYELYIKYGVAPTRSDYDDRYRRPFAADHSVEIPGTQAGDYYVLVYGDYLPNEPAEYQVLAELLDFSVVELSPSEGGNVGNVTVAIQGANLTEDLLVKLVAPDGAAYYGTQPYSTSPDELYVTFELAGAAVGWYDLHVTWLDGRFVERLAAFLVKEGSGPNLEVDFTMWGWQRPAWEFPIIVEYANTGDTDLIAPLLELQGSGDMPLSLTSTGRGSGATAEESDAAGLLQFFGYSTTGPAGILQPGDHEQITV
jgi:hypothetical protein